MTKRNKKSAPPQDQPAPKRNLTQIGLEIKALEKRTISNVVATGRLLEEAATLVCEHGTYMDWLADELGWSHSTSLRYRSVYWLSQNRQIDDFESLNISVSALYLLADLDLDCECKKSQELTTRIFHAIVEAARHGRVTYKMAKAIWDELQAACTAAEKAGFEIGSDEAPAEIVAAEVPSIVVADKAAPSSPRALITMVSTLMSPYWARADMWPEVIQEIGPAKFGEFIESLQAALDRYEAEAVKTSADHAEDEDEDEDEGREKKLLIN